MNIQTFLEHHGIVRNPFAEEDAQTDQVFKEYCISSAYHPIWDKAYGDPAEPSTAMIFGPKGSGKTAMRLQIDRHLQKYNEDNPNKRVFIIRYDDFNPFLDHFCERMNRRTTRKPEKVLDAFKLWDHMDAILCLGVTKLTDNILASGGKNSKSPIETAALKKLDRTAARDMLLLASSYDQSTEGAFTKRWNSLRKKLRYGNSSAKRSYWFAILWAVLVVLFFLIWFLRPLPDQPAEARVVTGQQRLVSYLLPQEATDDEETAAEDTAATDEDATAAKPAESKDEPAEAKAEPETSPATTETPTTKTESADLDASPMKATAEDSDETESYAGMPSASDSVSSFLGWFNSVFGTTRPSANKLWLAPLLILLGALPFLIRWIKTHLLALGIRKHMRVGKREVTSVRRTLLGVPAKELASQPLPRFNRTDDRYEMIQKFQTVLGQLGYAGTIVLMDRVDEPHMTGGKPELMRRFVWPLLDNKLLKHPGLGFKMMLPQELYRDMERESREFHERARLDKQNVIPAFQWTGEALYDLARARMRACAAEGKLPEPKDLFDEEIDYKRMLAAYQGLRVPRHLFRFLYRVLVDHCNRYTDNEPEFKIKAETFETVHAVYNREANPTAG